MSRRWDDEEDDYDDLGFDDEFYYEYERLHQRVIEIRDERARTGRGKNGAGEYEVGYGDDWDNITPEEDKYYKMGKILFERRFETEHGYPYDPKKDPNAKFGGPIDVSDGSPLDIHMTTNPHGHQQQEDNE